MWMVLVGCGVGQGQAKLLLYLADVCFIYQNKKRKMFKSGIYLALI